MSGFDIPTDPRWADEQLNDKLGIRFLEASVERVVATMPVAGNRQPYGLLHGGASAVLVEALGSVAAALHAWPRGLSSAGLELSCTHVRSAVGGLVTGIAVPVHLGGSVATHTVTITDEDERVVCTARLTCVLQPTASLSQRADAQR